MAFPFFSGFRRRSRTMHEGKMVFSQFMELVSWKSFQTCVDRHRGDWKVKSFYCREFFRVKVDKSKGILRDQKVRLTGSGADKKYPELIRRIKFIDPEKPQRECGNLTGQSVHFRQSLVSRICYSGYNRYPVCSCSARLHEHIFCEINGLRKNNRKMSKFSRNMRFMLVL